MSTNSISHTDPSPSSYTPPKTSRFLACGKLNPKYPEGLGKSVPSTFSGWPKFTREVPQPTLSPLASLSLPHTASGSYASESTLGSVENSPLQPKSSLLVHQKKLVVDEQVSAGDDPLERGAGSLQLENNLPLNPVQESVSSLTIISPFNNLKHFVGTNYTLFHLPPYTQRPISLYDPISLPCSLFTDRIPQPGLVLYFATLALCTLAPCYDGI